MKRFFTLVEILVALAIVAILTAVAVPSFQKHRENAQLHQVQSYVSQVKLAKERMAIDYSLSDGDAVDFDILKKYLVDIETELDLRAGDYWVEIGDIGEDPVCMERVD